VTVAATVEQTTELPEALVTVQLITPIGAGEPVCPVTIAFKTVLPPKVGELDALMLTVGVRLETPKVTVFEIVDK
jgi:hypothetical protein